MPRWRLRSVSLQSGSTLSNCLRRNHRWLWMDSHIRWALRPLLKVKDQAHPMCSSLTMQHTMLTINSVLSKMEWGLVTTKAWMNMPATWIYKCAISQSHRLGGQKVAAKVRFCTELAALPSVIPVERPAFTRQTRSMLMAHRVRHICVSLPWEEMVEVIVHQARDRTI